MMRRVLCFALVLAGSTLPHAQLGTGVQAGKDEQPRLAADHDRFLRFEQQLDQLRTLLKIPGLSAAVLRDQEVVWAKGFGFADRDRRVPATPDTPYHVASLTKTFAATLILRLGEQGKLDLDELASRYTADVGGDRVTIRHLLTHTSEGNPGWASTPSAGIERSSKTWPGPTTSTVRTRSWPTLPTARSPSILFLCRTSCIQALPN
jgi:CubicO group peptidase (beta-lactamase class C family)